MFSTVLGRSVRNPVITAAAMTQYYARIRVVRVSWRNRRPRSSRRCSVARTTCALRATPRASGFSRNMGVQTAHGLLLGGMEARTEQNRTLTLLEVQFHRHEWRGPPAPAPADDGADPGARAGAGPLEGHRRHRAPGPPACGAGPRTRVEECSPAVCSWRSTSFPRQMPVVGVALPPTP